MTKSNLKNKEDAMVRFVNIQNEIDALEVASRGEEVRAALIRALEVVEAIHNRKFHENGGEETNG